MTPAQVEAVIAKMRAKANAPMSARDPADGDAQDEANRIRYRVWDLAADMLTEALAESEAALVAEHLRHAPRFGPKGFMCSELHGRDEPHVATNGAGVLLDTWGP